MRRVLLVLVAVVSAAAPAAVAHAQPPPTSQPPTTEPAITEPPAPVTLPLVPVPAGCDAPPQPHIVFVGRVEDSDYRSVRFEIEQIRSGRPEPFGAGNLIDVRYGLDAQYLEHGERYLVSAVVHPDLGLLVSRVTPPVENFGGDEVIGVSESDVTCPRFEDPMRTLHVDGSPIDADVLEPFFSARLRVLGAVLIPLAVAFGAIFLLATFRLSVTGLYNSVAAAGRRSR